MRAEPNQHGREHLEQIGNVIVQFQDLEEALIECLTRLCNADGMTLRHLTCRLRFADIVAAFEDLCLNLGVGAPDQVRELCKAAYKVEARRNQIVHSLWIIAGAEDPVSFRIKQPKSQPRERAEPLSLQVKGEVFDTGSLAAIAAEIAAAKAQVLAFLSDSVAPRSEARHYASVVNDAKP